MAEVGRAGPHGYVHGWIKVGNVKAPADRYGPDVKFMKTEDVGKLVSDLEPGMTVEERYRRFPEKRADDTQKQLDKAIAKRGWDPSPVHVLNGDRLTDGHHTYAAARERGVSHLPVLHYQRAKRMSDPLTYRFNPHHAPAGSATGGQFAAASGGKSGSKASKDTRPTPTNAHPVGRGETGKRVSDLQSRLNALGFKPPLKVDGIFGPKTLAAVRAFQKSHGLKVDGLVGPKTTAALRAKAAPAKHVPAHTAPHKAAPKPAPKTVKRDADPYGHEHYAARSRLLREQAGLDW